jgi:hypothetical protein
MLFQVTIIYKGEKTIVKRGSLGACQQAFNRMLKDNPEKLYAIEWVAGEEDAN